MLVLADPLPAIVVGIVAVLVGVAVIAYRAVEVRQQRADPVRPVTVNSVLRSMTAAEIYAIAFGFLLLAVALFDPS